MSLLGRGYLTHFVRISNPTLARRFSGTCSGANSGKKPPAGATADGLE
ncbi:hypothetical protein RR11_1718 [Ruegeria sp. R11]|nr:hypothetical protein RR11_1718 [Ruegeria sp. R11]